jgi:hypothetical protein
MLKIVNFNPDTNQIGGAQVPYYAFSQWCRILDITHMLCSTSCVDDADWYFLPTPGSIEKGKDTIKLDAPFAVMVHADLDRDLYEHFDYYTQHAMCKLVVTVQNGWDFPRMAHWYPCTLPRYLIKEDTQFDNSNRFGLISASRISQWKGLNHLAALSLYKDFLANVDYRIDVYGEGSFDMLPGNYERKGQYSTYNIDWIKTLRQYRYFWDGAYHKDMTPNYKRLNLSAVEGIGAGCIPVVMDNSTHPMARKFAVTLSGGFPDNYEAAQERMKEVILNSPMSYEAVKSQVSRIIDIMESK